LLCIAAESASPSIYDNVLYLLFFLRVEILVGVELQIIENTRKSRKVICLSMIRVGSRFRSRSTTRVGIEQVHGPWQAALYVSNILEKCGATDLPVAILSRGLSGSHSAIDIEMTADLVRKHAQVINDMRCRH
jgi:hypothetical protein